MFKYFLVIMKAKSKNTVKKDLKSILNDKKYDTLIDSVLDKMNYSLSKGSFLAFPYVQNVGDYNIVIELVSDFIKELEKMQYSEFPNILLKGIDNNIVDFQFDGYDGFVERKLGVFKSIINQKITEAKILLQTPTLDNHSKYNAIISSYSLTHNGLKPIDIESNNSNILNSIQDKLNGLSEKFE